jgi:hypothetical protein
MYRRATALLSAVLAGALPALAADVDVRGSMQGDGRYNSAKDVVVIDGRVDFEADVGPLSFGGTYRAYDYGEGDYNPRGISPVYGIKHRYVEGRVGDLFFRGGHYFSTFGRGLTLRSFESVDLEYDTELDGFISEYARGPVTLTGLAGEVTERITDVQHLRHRLRGGRAQVRLGPMVSLAVSGVDRNTDREDTGMTLPDRLSKFADHVLGMESEIWLGPVSVAGEYASRRGDYYPELKQGDGYGHGTYVSATAGTSWSTLLAEYKNYEKFEDALTNPPTCVKEHVWVLMNRVTHQVNLDDERGFLGEGTLMPVEDLQVTGGASEARTHGGGLVHWEIFGQVDRAVPVGGVSSVAGSWSREYVSGKFTEYGTGAIDLAYDAGPLRTLEIEIEMQHTEEPTGEGFDAYLTSVACYPGSGLTVSVLGETTTQSHLERDFWISGDVRATISEGFEVSLGGGTDRGGKRCSGGICFTEPEFTGIRLRLLTYF